MMDYGSVKYDVSPYYDFSHIGIYTIEITQNCNLRCSYCCYSGDYYGRRAHNNSEISIENLERCVRFIMAHTPSMLPVVYVSFYGGEALLCIDKIKWIISELILRCPKWNFEFSISTNGLLLSETVVDWISSTPNLYITVTIDGDKIMHDKNRISVSGTGSFDIIIQNLSSIKNRHPDLFKERIRFISTVKSISDLIPLNDFWMNSGLLRDNRPQHISSIIPNFDKGDSVSFEPDKFERIYEMGFEHYCHGIEDILTDELHNLIKTVKHRDYILQTSPHSLTTCINTPESCFITAQGKLYVCEKFCEIYELGFLNSGFDISKCEKLNRMYIERKNTFCGNCWARRLCRRCLVGMNFNDIQFNQYCLNEKMQLKLALKYHCELLEFKHNYKSIF